MITKYKAFENGVKIRLSNFLSLVSYTDFNWTILYLDSTFFENQGFEKSINVSNKQESFCFNSSQELINFEKQLDDLHDILLVGAFTKEKICKQNFEADYFENYIFNDVEVVIELFDSSYWHIYNKAESPYKKTY